VFDLAESIWQSAEDQGSQQRAITYYKIACEKNDARSYLALYKINKEWKFSYLITGRQTDGLPYLNKALELGFLPAFFYAGSLWDIFQIYSRLIYLSIGLSIAHRTKDASFSEFQVAFLGLSKKFADEFIPEILRIGQGWIPGTPVTIEDSPLNGKSISIKHPTNYVPEIDSKRANWEIFSVKENLEEYLKQLPGSEEYQLAYDAQEDDDIELFESHMRQAAKKGNGQAMYALYREASLEIIRAAESGSPDGFMDLMGRINEFPEDWEFINPTKLSQGKAVTLLASIDCLIYLYTLMERLGLAKYGNIAIDSKCLSVETESGYRKGHAYVHELKYQFCDHEHVVSVNERAYGWQLGKSFDTKFIAQLKIAGLDYGR